MEQGRIRWAIWGPIIGFILLFFILRYAVNNFRADQVALEDLSVVTLQEVAINESMGMTATVDSETTAGVESATMGDSDETRSEEGVGASAGITATTEITDTVEITGTPAVTSTTTMTAVVVVTTTEMVDASGAVTVSETVTTTTVTTATGTTADEAVADEAVADEVVADEPVGDETLVDETVTDGAVVDEEAAATTLAEAVDTAPSTVWVMNTLNGERALGGWPIVAVIGDDGSITGSAGCNYYNASYSQDGDVLSVTPPASTTMLCPSDAAMTQEREYLNALTQVTAFDDQGMSLVLTGDDVEISFTSLRILERLSWLVASYRDEAGSVVEPQPNSAITANFDVTGNQMTGLNGCDNYMAGFSVQGDLIITEAPVVSQTGTGIAACEPGAELAVQAQAYMAAVQEARLYQMSASSLQLYDENHELVVDFVPVEE